VLVVEPSPTSDIFTVNFLSDFNPPEDTSFKPLLWSTERGELEMSMVLLDRGTKPDCKNDAGRTPLSLAAERGHKKLLRLSLSMEPRWVP
jgi:ankyrin repeat protein